MIDNPDFSLVWNNLGNVEAISVLGMPKTLGIWEWGCPKRGDAQNAVTPPSNNWALGTRLYFYYIIQPDSVIIRLDDVKVLKSLWNFVKTETTTPGNNIYTLLINFIAFTSFISSKFQTLFFPYKLSYYAIGSPYYAWATCGGRRGRLYTGYEVAS